MNQNKFDKWKTWVDHPTNPLIRPKRPEWLIADPTFMPPNDSPDKFWHMFANGILFGIYHFISRDGIKWINTHHKINSGMRPFLFKEDDVYYLLYEKFLNPFRSRIYIRESQNLFKWSKASVILKPALPWEGIISRKVGNPCLIKFNGKYRLYYSAGAVIMWDCFFTEPEHIGLAEAKSIYGPYERLDRPIISTSPKHKYRNLAAGGIKVLRTKEGWIGFNNGIFKRAQERSSSGILLLQSDDGIVWKDIFEKPIIYPTTGWKKSFIYQLDVKKVGPTYYLYYNARDGWIRGWEGIGLATLKMSSTK